MKGFKVLMTLWALIAAGCAVPLGQDYVITRDGTGLTYITDYNLQTYVPIPEPERQPVVQVTNRGELDMSVVWKDENGAALALPFTFAPDTVYQAEITITPKGGYGFYATPFAYPPGKVEDQSDDMGDPVRTVTVTYNNSDDWNITYITDYNLQNYVPVPLAGEKPVWTVDRPDIKVTAVWSEKDSSAPLDTSGGSFMLGAEYRADIRLTTKEGYRFIQGRNFTYADGPPVTPVTEANPDARRCEVTYPPTMSPTVITDFNLTAYIPRPVSGAAPVVSFAGFQYTGIVNWKNTAAQDPVTGSFLQGTAYTAELLLNPAAGYTFTGVGANQFVHTGAEAVIHPGGGSVTIVFPSTQGAGTPIVVYDTILTGYLPKPVNGITPVTGIAGLQYSGTVAWNPPHGTFQLNTSYTADLTLSAAPGYTFAGIGQNVFTHGDGTAANPAGSGTVRVVFPAARVPSHGAVSFGPAGAENSALLILKERRASSGQVYVELANGDEPVGYSTILVPYDTSPAEVIIDGRGRTLTKTSPGPLLTVSGGVTLTLQNITLRGYDGNSASLITVLSGGKLILGTGAVLAGNNTDSDAGGVTLNGGSLIMNPGAAIRGMRALRAGAVLVGGGGRFLMTGGTIGGTADGNIAAGRPDYSSAGGVLVEGGSFDMYGGTIAGNEANVDYSAGGVCIIEAGGEWNGTFNHYGGTITGNVATANYSAGGVNVPFNGDHVSCTISGSAVIEYNIAQGSGVNPEDSGGNAGSGGGVRFAAYYNCVIEGGKIQYNEAWGANSGGGVYGTGKIYGGTIQHNSATGANSGGGLYSTYSLLYGGTIQYNTAGGTNSGGGIYGGINLVGPVVVEYNEAKATAANSGGGLYAVGMTEISNGIIMNNKARGSGSGGGVYVGIGAHLYMNEFGPDGTPGPGGVIKGNQATGSLSAGAVYVYGDGGWGAGVFNLRHGTIGGDVPNTGTLVNGVYTGGSLILFGGEITGNTGANNYGVYVAYNSGEQGSRFQIYEGGKVDAGNLVFLEAGVSITTQLDTDGSGVVANITCENLVPYGYGTPTKLMRPYGAIDEDRFLYESRPFYLEVENDGTSDYGYFNGYKQP
jgi:hypothetical protein